jgi:hypothetical protein
MALAQLREKQLAAQRGGAQGLLGRQDVVTEEETPEAGVPRTIEAQFPSPQHRELYRDIGAGLNVPPSGVQKELEQRGTTSQKLAQAETERIKAAYQPLASRNEADLKALDIKLKQAEIEQKPLEAAKLREEIAAKQGEVAKQGREATKAAEADVLQRAYLAAAARGDRVAMAEHYRQLQARGHIPAGPEGPGAAGVVAMGKAKTEFEKVMIETATDVKNLPTFQTAAQGYNDVSFQQALTAASPVMSYKSVGRQRSGITGESVTTATVPNVPTAVYQAYSQNTLGSGQATPDIQGPEGQAGKLQPNEAVAWDIYLREYANDGGDVGKMARRLDDPTYYAHIQDPRMRENTKRYLLEQMGGRPGAAPAGAGGVQAPQQPGGLFPPGTTPGTATPRQIGGAMATEAGRALAAPLQAGREAIESVGALADKPVKDIVKEAIQTPFEVGGRIVEKGKQLTVPDIKKREAAVAGRPAGPGERYTPEGIVSAGKAGGMGDPAFLLALRKAEAGRPGLEFGVFGPGGNPKTAPDDQLGAVSKLVPVYERDYVRQTRQPAVGNDGKYTREFLEYFSRRYAPLGAANDPKGLNRHHLPNLLKSYYGS